MWGIARISVILSVGAVEESKYCFFLGLDSIMTVFESPRFSFFSSSSSFNPDKQSVFCYLKELLKPCSIYSDADRMCAMSCLALVNSRGSNHMTTVVAVVQSLSCVWLFATPWTAARQASVSFTISTPGFRVFRYLPEFAHTHVHWVSDAIQPSHPLLPPSSPVLSLSQHQGLSPWIGSSNQVAKELELQLQHPSFQWIFRIDWLPLGLTCLILLSWELSTVFSSTTLWKHQHFSTQPSLWSNSRIHTWLLEKL